MLNRSSLFNRPRFKLAGAYAGAMGVLLSVLGIALHEAIANSADEIIERELKTLSAVLEGAITPLLLQPGQLSPSITQAFPEFCLTGTPCPEQSANNEIPSASMLVAVPPFTSLQEEGYHIRLLDLAGAPVATLGSDQHKHSFDALPPEVTWQFTQAGWGDRHRVYSLPLMSQATVPSQPWGYLQVGCSYQALEKYMHLLHWLLLVGLPLGIGIVGLTAWWLSGMAMRPIAESYERIEQFTADVAHELRTPLSAMRATAEAELSQQQLSLSNRPSSAEMFPAHSDSSVLPKLHRQILRLSKLVQDLLLLSRLEHDRQPLIQEQVHLNELLDDLEEEFAPLILASQLDFKLLLPSENIAIQANPDALYRLFINLISNAIQHTPLRGSIIVTLTADSMARVTVQDSGSGIEPAMQKRIFTRFYRVESDRSPKVQGGSTGLGLAIAQAIAQQHNGNIQLTSSLGQGSCFTVSLPRARS